MQQNLQHGTDIEQIGLNGDEINPKLIFSNPGVDNNSTALKSLVGGIQARQRLYTGYMPKSRDMHQGRRSHSSFLNAMKQKR